MKEIPAEIKEDVKGVMHAAYKDILHPSMQVVGKSLGATLEFFLTPFAGLQLVNDRMKANIQRRLQQYAEKLQQVPKMQQCEVHPELGVPILQRLSYTTNDDIANMFVELLTHASNMDTVGLAHPSFIPIIDRLSPDEARLLKYIHESNNIVLYVNFRAKPIKEKVNQEGALKLDMSYVELKKWLTIVERDVHLDFPENLPLYWANLISCGLVYDAEEIGLTEFDEKYKEIEEYNKIEVIRQELVPSKYREINPRHSFFQLTALGMQFLAACVIEPASQTATFTKH